MSDPLAILRAHKQILIVGLSPDPAKPSHYVPLYMRGHGYEIRGVHPRPQTEFAVYPKLGDVPTEWLEFVVAFLDPKRIPALVDELIALGDTEALWLQLGITEPASERQARAAGMDVVSDRCLMIEHRALV